MSHPEHPDTWLVPAGWFGTHLVQVPTVLRGVHLEHECLGQPCLVHRPSDHHMRHWPLLWWDEQKVFQRLCPHMLAHPDPDGWGEVEHDCDGCCQP
jgi:hypothetical protein